MPDKQKIVDKNGRELTDSEQELLESHVGALSALFSHLNINSLEGAQNVGHKGGSAFIKFADDK
jgi:hypothetical protein